jgi:hypothetical protein
MRQVIVSKVGVAKSAVGAVQLQVLSATGVWTEWAAASTDQDPLYRIYKKGDADNVEQATPPFRRSAIKEFEAISYVNSSPQTSTLTPTAGVVDKPFTLKIIETSQGYEPFPRVNIEISTGTASVNATATAINTAVAAAIAVEGSVASKIMASSSNPTGTCAIIAKDGMRLEFALDAQDSTVGISNAKTNAVAGIGVPADIIKEEKAQQGREYSGYDRLVAFDSFADVTVAAVGSTYHLFRFIVENQTPNQINGVDNMREIKVYLERNGAGDPHDLKDATDNAGFNLAVAGELNHTVAYLD